MPQVHPWTPIASLYDSLPVFSADPPLPVSPQMSAESWQTLEDIIPAFPIFPLQPGELLAWIYMKTLSAPFLVAPRPPSVALCTALRPLLARVLMRSRFQTISSESLPLLGRAFSFFSLPSFFPSFFLFLLFSGDPFLILKLIYLPRPRRQGNIASRGGVNANRRANPIIRINREREKERNEEREERSGRRIRDQND